jgi:uncharacterized membrane protein YbhN (UPF0104 family)
MSAAVSRRTAWAWVRPIAGAGILAALVARLGTGPFLDGVRTIDVRSLAAAAGIALVTTTCCAWRWSIVARGLGVEVPLGSAIAAYYRSQFLNTTLPGGVVGDVHRAVRHGRDVGDVSRSLRSVMWERAAGQVVQAAITAIVLLALPSPVQSAMPVVVVVAVAAALGGVLLSRRLPHDGSSRTARASRTVAADLHDGLLARQAWPGIVLTSALVVAGYTATFLIAARTAGVTASTVRLLPLAVLALLAMAVPTNVGGWGPREGVAAWTFGLAGMGASLGVATAVVYGAMALVANLPGAAVLVGGWLRRSRARRDSAAASPWRSPAAVRSEGGVRG